MTNDTHNLCKLANGVTVMGKWHRHSYTIIKQLGSGANGIVYLAKSVSGIVALKLSGNGTTIISEVNVLKQLSKVQGKPLGPSLLDVDDFVHPVRKTTVSFYVMEYVSGIPLLTFLEEKGTEWLSVLMLQLLDDLGRLHQKGWVFGDLKPDNLVVSVDGTPKIRWIDVGGTTLQGRAIKEFTEFFDRGYWGCGSRKAEASYDLFAVAMIMINAFYPKRFLRKDNRRQQIIEVIEHHTNLNQYKTILLKAIDGKYKQAKEMKQELIIFMGRPKRAVRKRVTGKMQTHLLETALLIAFVAFGYVLYLYRQLL